MSGPRADRDTVPVMLIWLMVISLVAAIGVAGAVGALIWLVLPMLVVSLVLWRARVARSRVDPMARLATELIERIPEGDSRWSTRTASVDPVRPGEILTDQQWRRLAWYWSHRPLAAQVGYTQVADHRRVWSGCSVTDSSSREEDERVAPQELRDSLWRLTVGRESVRRRALVRRMSDIAGRLDEMVPVASVVISQAYRECAVELAQVLATVPGPPPLSVSQARERLLEWVGVPAREVVDLGRPVRALCDCRFGHVDYHAIVGHDAASGAVMRECTYCEPATRWRELGVSPGKDG